MNAILIYASCYGTTRRYAEELSRRTGWPAVSFKELPDLSGYDTVVHMGGLYAEKLMGLDKTVKALPEGAKLIVVTVGLGDPSVPASAERLRKNLKKHLPAGLEAEFFHLRGAMDMEKLTLRHKMMLKAFFAVMSRTAMGKDSDMGAAQRGPVDYVDFSALAPPGGTAEAVILFYHNHRAKDNLVPNGRFCPVRNFLLSERKGRGGNR